MKTLKKVTFTTLLLLTTTIFISTGAKAKTKYGNIIVEY